MKKNKTFINPATITERQKARIERQIKSIEKVNPRFAKGLGIKVTERWNKSSAPLSTAIKTAIAETSLMGLQVSEVETIEKLIDVNYSSTGVTVKSNFSVFSEQLQRQLEEIQNNFLENMLQSIKNKTPVRTGAAQNGWEIVNNKIVNPVPYVKYLEYGTEKMRPIAMMASTVANSQDLLSRAIENSTPIQL